MTWHNDPHDDKDTHITTPSSKDIETRTIVCPSCGHCMEIHDKVATYFPFSLFLFQIHLFICLWLWKLFPHIGSLCVHIGLIENYLIQAGLNDLPGLPAGVRFDPNDQEILEHLEAKVLSNIHKLHPLIDEFIPTLEGENGICYTHPEKLPGDASYSSWKYKFIQLYRRVFHWFSYETWITPSHKSTSQYC